MSLPGKTNSWTIEVGTQQHSPILVSSNPTTGALRESGGKRGKEGRLLIGSLIGGKRGKEGRLLIGSLEENEEKKGGYSSGD
ncbi:hypothetical protein ACOMHN_060335 [Nucella lapillus]